MKNGLLILFACLGTALGETVWQIGNFDESSSEFSHWRDPITGQRKLDYADPKQDPVFIVGESDSRQSWYAFQPGSAASATGGRAHPFEIRFELPERRAGQYVLRLGLLAYSSRLPRVQIELNGHRGEFYQQPILTYSAGDHAVFYLPHYSKVEITAVLPVACLRSGTNRLVLTAIDETDALEHSRPSGFPWPGNSGIVYDAVALERRGKDEAQPTVMAWAAPTIFYRMVNGRLHERIDLFVRINEKVSRGRVTFTLGTNRVEHVLAPRELGEQLFQIEVPEFAPGAEAVIVVRTESESKEFRATLSPARQWTLLMVPNEHLDIGYTDFVPKVAELQSRSIDDALDLIDRHSDFRFTVEGFWVIEEFLRGRSAHQRSRLSKAVRERKVLVPASYGSFFTGLSGLETLVRSHYPSWRYLAEVGGGFDHAVNTDVPSYSWAYPSVLAAAGIRYFVAASDAYRAPFLLRNRLHESSPHWWEGPDGSRVIVWYSRHYHQLASLFGMPPSLTLGEEALPRFLQAYSRSSYKSAAVLIYGSQVENVALFSEQASLADRWNERYAFPRLEYAGFAEALNRIVEDHKGELPVVRGDGGPYWEDGLGANAVVTSLARENERRATAAEKFATVSALLNWRVSADTNALQQIWRHLFVINEHTWHAHCSVRDPDSDLSRVMGADKDAHAIDGQRLIDYVVQRSLSAISDAIGAPSGTFVLFNSLNWARRDLIETDIPSGQIVVDPSTDQAVPLQVLRSGPVFQRVRFVSPEVPAFGFRCLQLRFPSEVRPEDAASPTALPDLRGEETTIENRFYRVEFDRESGSVASIFDKELKRELVDRRSSFRFNQFLYVTGADQLPNRLVQYSTVSPKPELRIHGAQNGRLLGIERTGFGTVAKLESSTVNTPTIQTEIIVLDDEKKIVFVNRITKVKTRSKEAAYFAFPFSIEHPQYRLATQVGYVDPAKDLLPGACREWFTIQDWAAVSDSVLNATFVPVNAPLITIGDIARGEWPEEFGRRNATIFSYVMNNYTPEGYAAAQGGEMTFRYVITSERAWDPVRVHRFAVGENNPLEKNEVTVNDTVRTARMDPARLEGSWLNLEPANVSLVALKPAEDARGIVLRVVEVSGRDGELRLSAPGLKVREAWLCNAVEENERELQIVNGAVRVPFERFQIVTIRLVGVGDQSSVESR